MQQLRSVTTASGNNRQNTQGIAQPGITGRSTIQIANIVPAGGTLPVPCTGSFFYFTVLTAIVEVRASGGAFSVYGQGQGLDVGRDSAFSLLEIKNPHAFPVVFQVVAGFDGFIDNTLIINQTTGENNVVVATLDTVNSVNSILIPDLAGTKITDSNGREWYAMKRNAFVVTNADAAAVYTLTNTDGTKDLTFYQPLTSIRLPWSGNFKIAEAGPLNLLVAEEYQAVPATVA